MNRINLILIITFLLSSSSQGQYLINDILNYGNAEYSTTRAEEYYTEAALMRQNYGLSFNASAQHRFGEGFIEGDLTENNGQTFYKAGVSWDILKGGWLFNQSRADQFDLKAQLESLSEQKETKNRTYFAQYSYSAYVFDKWILDIYTSRENFLKSKKPLFSSLTRDGYFTNRENLELDARLTEVNYQIKNLSYSNQAFESIFGKPLPVTNKSVYAMPDIKITKLLEDLETSQSLILIVKSRKELNQQPNFWIEDVSVKASVNYNHQVSFTDSRRDFVSAGLTLSIPVYRNYGIRNQQFALANKKIDEEFDYEIANLKKELLMLYQEYAYKQKQLANTYSTIEILEEKIRVQTIQKVSVNSDLPTIDASLLKDDLYSVTIEQLSLSKQMVQLIVRMNTLIPDSEISEYLIYKPQEFMSSNKEVK